MSGGAALEVGNGPPVLNHDNVRNHVRGAAVGSIAPLYREVCSRFQALSYSLPWLSKWSNATLVFMGYPASHPNNASSRHGQAMGDKTGCPVS